jgi:hypothetical protein
MRWKSEDVAPGSSVAKLCSSVSGREPTTCRRQLPGLQFLATRSPVLLRCSCEEDMGVDWRRLAAGAWGMNTQIRLI